MNAPERFTKVSDRLIALGLAPRLAMLYGRLAYHAADGACCPKHATLAEEIGLTSREHLARMLKKLQELRLIEWSRGRRFNCYRVLPLDVTLLSHLKPPPDVTPKSHLKASRCDTEVTSMCDGEVTSQPPYLLMKRTIRKEGIERPPVPVQVSRSQNGKPPAAGPPQKWQAFAVLYPPPRLNHAQAKTEWGRLTARRQATAIGWLERHRHCPQWQANGGQFIPLASNFLKKLVFESPPPPLIERKGPQSQMQKLEQKHNVGVALMKFQRGEKR